MFGLDPAPSYHLARPPIVEALGQVRFPVLARLNSLDGIAPVQDRLERIFPYMKLEQVQQVSLFVGASGSSGGENRAIQTWRFTDDSGWSVIIAPDRATLSADQRYEGFSQFADHFYPVLAALAEGAGVSRAERLGLRYLNVAEIPLNDKGAWRQWFRPELVGWSDSEAVADTTRLLTSITQTHLSAAPVGELSGPPVDIQALIRNGLIPAETMIPGSQPRQPHHPAYLLDIDLFIDAPQTFDVEELSRQMTMLHDQIDRFFFWAVAEEGARYFGRELR